MTKTYRELTNEERIKTYNKYQNLCEECPEIIPYESFEEYNDDQCFLDGEFDAETLEFLG